ncbi:hypothetical protein [Rhizobium sp. PP-F2F-G48]|uniref:hypothetical protein n=1 Tax=Rhizobium sp. PP-F2F-G48 TaxID=2135651 RepID=UPI001405516D|nr:hypothetical protein [Rhizobium sp. PP-F2F-G48]
MDGHPDEFATEALAKLEADKDEDEGEDEVLVDVPAKTSELGEAIFDRMNSRVQSTSDCRDTR